MSHITTRRWQLSRRHALRGLGTTLALPFLDCMRPMHGFAEVAAARPRRSVFIYLPNGVNTIDFQISEAGADYTFSKILSPLAKHRAVVTPISGLYHPNGLGHHHNCQKIWLTGGKLGATDRNTISVDQLMAQKTAEITRWSSLELTSDGPTLAWTADGIGLPAERTPSVVFKRLFEIPTGGLDKQRRNLDRKGSILDLVLDDAKQLDSKLGQADRGRLEQYLTSVREVEVRTERSTKWLDTPLPKVDAAARARVDRPVSQQMVGEYFRTMYDLVVLSFQTDMTRIISFKTGRDAQNRAFPEGGVNLPFHPTSHHGDREDKIMDFNRINKFRVGQLPYLLDRLKQTQVDGGSLIEKTLVVWGSPMSDPNVHNHRRCPMMLFGKANGMLKGNLHIKAAADTPMANVFLTLAHGLGMEDIKSFGDSTGEQSVTQAAPATVA